MRLPSSSAWLSPHSMPPISWLRASFGFSTRPGANAPTIRRTRTSPSSGSTATSANCAPNVSSPCGVSSAGGRQPPTRLDVGEVVRAQQLAVASRPPRAGRAGHAAVANDVPPPDRRRAAATPRPPTAMRDQLLAQRGAGRVHGGADHPRAGRADGRRRVGQVGVADLELERARVDAERVGGDLVAIAVARPVPNSCVPPSARQRCRRRRSAPARAASGMKSAIG